MKGRYSPDAAVDEWCDRRLLARIHRYTVKRLRAEIEPVAARDFLRFLLTWQHVAPDARMEGSAAMGVILNQLEGFEAPVGAWESEILPARLSRYDPAWLDRECRAGRVSWMRLRHRSEGGSAPIRSTPITLVERKRAAVWMSLSPRDGNVQASHRTGPVLDFIHTHGASFFDDLVEGTGQLRSEVEEALAELVGLGLVNADSFNGLRALIAPADQRQIMDRRRPRAISPMDDAGRWSLAAGKALADDQHHEAVAHAAQTLLRRYGVVFWALLEREAAWLPPWRDLLGVFRRMEARGEIRGGRFVSGFAGEQYALPEAVGLLRDMRRKPETGILVSVSGTDPLNLAGVLTPGAKLPALTNNRLLYRDGLPVAWLAAGELRFLEDVPLADQWEYRKVLERSGRLRPGRTSGVPGLRITPVAPGASPPAE
jgi:ATP-dependent Lhr-like helicase